MKRKIFFVSDLHLLSSRSSGDRHFETMSELASTADMFVFGGDIFDFRWSMIRSSDWAVDTAAAWLHRFCRNCPNCDVHYVLGNHDYHQPFINRLEEESKLNANLHWHEYLFRLEHLVFLHGDVVDRDMTTAEFRLRRQRCLHHKTKGRAMNTLYDLAVLSRVHVPMPHLARGRKKVVRRLLAHLQENGHGPEQGVHHVYFGHTHVPLSGYQYGGLTFHNSGATIQGVRFEILEVIDQVTK